MSDSGPFDPRVFGAVAQHVSDLNRGESRDAARIRSHTMAICRWLQKCFPDDPETQGKRAPELALAYGLGARREFTGLPQKPLDGIWQGAVEWLRAELDAAVSRGLELPLAMIPGFADNAPAVYEAVIDLFNWMVLPAAEAELEMDARIDFSSYPDRLEIRSPHGRHWPVYPGQRRTYLLKTGAATTSAPRCPVPAPWLPGGRLITRAGDFAAAKLHLLPAAGTPTDLPFGAFEFASVRADEFCWFEDLSCKCGRDTCPAKHRIGGFHPPHLHPKTTLRSFIHSAVKGPLPKATPKSFKAGMLYAWLANRPGDNRLREAPLLRERVLKNPSDRFRAYYDTVEGLVRACDSEPERRMRCEQCGSLEPSRSSACGFCGCTGFRPNPVTVWAYQGPQEGSSLEELQSIAADDGMDIESRLISAEESWHPDWEVAFGDEHAPN